MPFTLAPNIAACSVLGVQYKSMTTLWLIIQREFTSNVLTSRFMIGFVVCLMSTAAAVFVQVEDYEKRLSAYHTALQEHQQETRTWDLYSQINPKAHRKPNPLSIFNVGMEKSGADMVSIELATPIWEKEAQKQGSDNPFLSIFLSVDVIFVFKIVLSALAILFAYNTISGEREDGTLKLVLSNPVPRGELVLGKYLGGVLSLFPIVVMSFSVGIVIAYASPATDFSGDDLLRLVMVPPCFTVVRIHLLSFRDALISVDKGSSDYVDPLNVYLGSSDDRSFKYSNLCSREIPTA